MSYSPYSFTTSPSTLSYSPLPNPHPSSYSIIPAPSSNLSLYFIVSCSPLPADPILHSPYLFPYFPPPHPYLFSSHSDNYPSSPPLRSRVTFTLLLLPTLTTPNTAFAVTQSPTSIPTILPQLISLSPPGIPQHFSSYRTTTLNPTPYFILPPFAVPFRLPVLPSFSQIFRFVSEPARLSWEFLLEKRETPRRRAGAPAQRRSSARVPPPPGSDAGSNQIFGGRAPAMGTLKSSRPHQRHSIRQNEIGFGHPTAKSVV